MIRFALPISTTRKSQISVEEPKSLLKEYVDLTGMPINAVSQGISQETSPSSAKSSALRFDRPSDGSLQPFRDWKVAQKTLRAMYNKHTKTDPLAHYVITVEKYPVSKFVPRLSTATKLNSRKPPKFYKGIDIVQFLDVLHDDSIHYVRVIGQIWAITKTLKTSLRKQLDTYIATLPKQLQSFFHMCVKNRFTWAQSIIFLIESKIN